jgi:hypothetical protein
MVLKVLKVSRVHKETGHRVRSVHKETEVRKVLRALPDQQVHKVFKEAWDRKVLRARL